MSDNDDAFDALAGDAKSADDTDASSMEQDSAAGLDLELSMSTEEEEAANGGDPADRESGGDSEGGGEDEVAVGEDGGGGDEGEGSGDEGGPARTEGVDGRAPEVNGDGDGDGEVESKAAMARRSEQEAPIYASDQKDDDYFAGLSQEEKDWYDELGPKPEEFVRRMVECTACHKQLESVSGANLQRHPLLGVVLCRRCRLFYHDGQWDTEEDGTDKYCRWCANGGELICCDVCPRAFCKRCLQRNLGRKAVANILSEEEWRCLICNLKQIWKYRAEYFVAAKYLKNASASPEKAPKRGAAARGSGNATIKNLQKSPADNFIDENIQVAFKTLATYQKALDNQRKAWSKVGKELTLEKVAPVCKALRKVFVTTRKNMDLLDDALVESFEKEFPGELKLIKVAKPTTPGSSGKNPAKRKGSPIKAGSAKKPKVSARAKAKPKQKKQTSEAVVDSGSSEDEDDFTSPAKRMSSGTGSNKVSLSLFGKKKKAKPAGQSVDMVDVSDSDSDLDLLPTSPKKLPPPPPASNDSPDLSQERPTTNGNGVTPKPGPKSAKKPGPASSKKPGPASSKKPGPASATKKPGPASATKKPGPASVSATQKPGPASSKKPGPASAKKREDSPISSVKQEKSSPSESPTTPPRKPGPKSVTKRPGPKSKTQV